MRIILVLFSRPTAPSPSLLLPTQQQRLGEPPAKVRDREEVEYRVVDHLARPAVRGVRLFVCVGDIGIFPVSIYTGSNGRR